MEDVWDTMVLWFQLQPPKLLSLSLSLSLSLNSSITKEMSNMPGTQKLLHNILHSKHSFYEGIKVVCLLQLPLTSMIKNVPAPL